MKITTVEIVREYTGHKDSIFNIQLDESGKYLFSGSADGLIVKWNLSGEIDGISIANVYSPIWSLYSDIDFLIAGTSKGNIHFIDLKIKKEYKNIVAHSGGVFSIIKNCNYLLTGGADGFIKKWDSDCNLTNQNKISDKSIRQILEVNSNTLLVACSDNFIYVINSDLEIIKKIEGHTSSVFCLCHIPALHQFISGSRDATLRIWNSKFDLTQKINAHLYHIHSINLSPCQKLFATSSMDKTIKIWDSESKNLLKVIDYEKHKSHTNCVNKVLWITSNELISCSDDRRILHFKINIDYDTE